MKTTITANRSQFRLFTISGFTLLTFIAIFISVPTLAGTTLSIYIICAFTFVLFLSIHAFIFLPSRLIFDTSNKKIEINYLLGKSENISLEDIKWFTYTTFGKTKGAFQGDFIYLSDKKKILISEFSLKDHRPFEKYLEEEKVPYKGEEKARLLAYYFQYLKR